MPTVELTTYYDIPIHCPFCGAPSTVFKDGVPQVGGCPHLLLFTAEEFTIHVDERLEKAAVAAGYKVTREDDDIRAEPLNDDDDYGDFVELAQNFPDVVIFEQIVGPPSLQSSFTAFAYSDEEHAAFGEAL